MDGGAIYREGREGKNGRSRVGGGIELWFGRVRGVFEMWQWTLEAPRADPVLSACSLVLGHDLFQQHPLIPVGSAQPWPEPPAPPPAQAPTLRQGCFYLLVLVPITCALLQLFTWSRFTLHGRRLHTVKAQRQNLSRAQTLDIKTV